MAAVTQIVTDHFQYWVDKAHGYFEPFHGVEFVRGSHERHVGYRAGRRRAAPGPRHRPMAQGEKPTLWRTAAPSSTPTRATG